MTTTAKRGRKAVHYRTRNGKLVEGLTRISDGRWKVIGTHLTLLGRACGNSSLSFRSAIRLVEMLRAYGPGLTAERLIALVQALPELDGTYTPMQKRGQAESRWPGEVVLHYGRQVAQALQRHVENELTFNARCKRAAILRAWVSGVPMEQIEKEATVNPFNSIGAGHVRGFADATRFHLRSAAKIVTALLITDGPSEQDIEATLHQLEAGLPADTLGLLKLTPPLSRGECLLLRRHGVKSAEAFWSLTAERLADQLGTRRAAEFERHRPPAVESPRLEPMQPPISGAP